MPAITVRVVDQFGKSTVHPICATAHVFASIAGTKTLSPQNLDRIRFLGYEILLDSTPAIAAARQTARSGLSAARGQAFNAAVASLRPYGDRPALERL